MANAAQKPLLNGRAWDWASINVNLLERPLVGITALSYEDSQNKVNNPGAGIFASSRGYGLYEAKASITLEMKEVERIEDALPPGQRLTDIPPFNIPIAYVNASNRMVRHTLCNAEFTNNKRTIKTGDTNIEVELELIISHINWK